MRSVTGAAVFLILTTFVVGTPFVNDLQPGQEWPPRSSVKQPSDPIPGEIDEIPKETQEPENIQNSLIIEAEKEQVEKNDEILAIVENVSEPVFDEAIKAVNINVKSEELQKVDYSGAQLWKVSTDKSGVRQVISRLKRRNLISTWAGNGTAVDVLVKPTAIENVTRVLKTQNISYSIMIEDLQRMIDEENPPLDENEAELQDRRARAFNFWRYRAQRLSIVGAYMGYNSLNIPMEYWPNAHWGHRMNWKQYHRLDDIHGFMDYLAKTYPNIASVNTIGKSHEGRELKMIRISDGKPTNKAVLIDGGIHAREWISPATVTYFINQFAENFDVESDDIKNIDWYIIPVLNPDGYEFTHVGDRLWRKNRRLPFTGRACTGIDLNRNFGYRWGGKGTSSNPCSEIYRGTKAFSEPESKALSDFVTSSAAKFSAYLTYHSYGQYLLYPWGYDNVVPPDYKDMDIVGKRIAEAIENTSGHQYQVGSSSKLLYPAAGGSDDWAKAQGIKYSYTIELSDTGRYGFILPTSQIEPVAKGSLAGLRVLAAQINKE